MLEKSINLTERNLHGPIYFDNNFKGFSLDPTGTKLAFIAEKKRAKSSGFFQNTGSSMAKCHKLNQCYNKFWWISICYGFQHVFKALAFGINTLVFVQTMSLASTGWV